MPIESNGWNTDWNKPTSELTPHERQALQEWTSNTMWAARLARQQKQRPTQPQPPRRTTQQAHQEEERRRKAEQAKVREWNEGVNWSVAGFIVVSIACLISGMTLHGDNPDSQLAGVLVTIGVIGCILIVPAIVVGNLLKK